jgi:hypothetical protein
MIEVKSAPEGRQGGDSDGILEASEKLGRRPQTIGYCKTAELGAITKSQVATVLTAGEFHGAVACSEPTERSRPTGIRSIQWRGGGTGTGRAARARARGSRGSRAGGRRDLQRGYACPVSSSPPLMRPARPPRSRAWDTQLLSRISGSRIALSVLACGGGGGGVGRGV